MKLLRLEWKKINPAPYLGTALGLLALGIFIALLFCFLPESERGAADREFTSGWRSLILLVSCVTLFSYAMLGAVLSSKVILDEFLGKKRLLVFSWPVSRRQLFAAKTALIFLFTAAGTFLSNLLSVSTALFFPLCSMDFRKPSSRLIWAIFFWSASALPCSHPASAWLPYGSVSGGNPPPPSLQRRSSSSLP